MIARKQEISRQLNELIDAPPAGESRPSTPSANIAGSPSLEELLVLRNFPARVIVASRGPPLSLRTGPWAPLIKQDPEALNGDRRDILPGAFVPRRNARFPRAEESNRANAAWISPAKLLEIQIPRKVHFIATRMGSLRRTF
jgi:hypothetical protein